MFKCITNCFDTLPVNKGRQPEIDIAKGFTIILMAFSHGIEILGWFFDPMIPEGFFWGGFDMLIKVMAPVFIFCMGITMSYSRTQTAGGLFMRALKMGGIMLLLELCRTVVPNLIEWLIFRDYESMIYVYQTLCVDILQFVTLAFFAMALLKYLGLNPLAMIAIGTVLSVAGQLLAGLSFESDALNYVVGYLWNSHDTSYFPFFSWFIVPVLGYASGYFWLRIKDKERLFRLTTPVCFAVGVLYFISMAIVGKWYYFSNENYCAIGILDVLFMFVIFYAVVGCSYYFFKYAKRVAIFFAAMGSRLTSIYCIHWTIYAFLYLTLRCVMGENYLPMWTVVPVAILIVVISDALSRVYKSYTAK